MSKKFKLLFVIYTVSALATLGVLSAVLYSRLDAQRLARSYSSASAFETTVSAVNGMSLALKKSLYATDSSLGRSLCSQVYANSLAAEAALSTLPFSTQELEELSGFLNLAGDYAQSLCAQAEDELSEQQREKLNELSALAEEFSARLRELQGQLNAELISMDTREELLQNVGMENKNMLSAELLGYEDEFEPPEAFEYEGRYSLPTEAKAGSLSLEEAKELAAEAVGVEVRELKDEYSYEGSDNRRCYSYDGLFICVSSRGLERISQSRLVDEGRMDPEAALSQAEVFLRQLGYSQLSLSSQGSTGSIAAFRFVPVQDEALRLDDYISLSVALDDGSIYAYDASHFSDESVETQWSVSEDMARSALPASLSELGCRRVIIKSPGGKYMACYEFDCTNQTGETVAVRVDASSGRQCEIKI